MTMRRKDVFVCDYDGADTATVYSTPDPPAGWIVNKDRSGLTHYWHNLTHATNGTGGVLGGVYSGGRTTTWEWTDEQDATVVNTTDDQLPTGWQVVKVGDVQHHFKNLANASAWLAAQ